MITENELGDRLAKAALHAYRMAVAGSSVVQSSTRDRVKAALLEELRSIWHECDKSEIEGNHD
jgi:hypothetical protein